MQDLRLLAIETEFVVLEGANGEQYRLALDEAVRKALRNERGPRSESESVSPREIQELVRSGHTVEDIVEKTSASFAFVEKFAVPVLEELGHVVSSAQSVRLAFLGERYGETNHIEFGALIRERLEQLGASNIRWSARRNETGGWQVSCDFELENKASVAKWSFDPRHLSLSPENEVALNLAANPKADALLPKAKPVIVSDDVIAVEPAPTPVAAPYAVSEIKSAPGVDTPLVGKNLTMSLGDTQEFAEVIPFGRGRNTTAQVPVIAAGTSAEISDDEEVAQIEDGEDLLEGLRRRRDLREAKTGYVPMLEVVRSGEQSESEPLATEVESEDDETIAASDFDETTVWIESSDEVFVDEEDVSQDAEDAPAEPQTSAPAKRGRASMPSWDQIVFGTKPDNKDD
jgi:hypothetical protein